LRARLNDAAYIDYVWRSRALFNSSEWLDLRKTLKYSMSRPFSVTTGWGTPLPKGIKERLKIHAVVWPEECKGGNFSKKKINISR